MRRRSAAMLAPLLFLLPHPAPADEPTAPRTLPAFDRIVIDDDLPGAYQVEVADLNADGRPDVIALGGDTCAWYENPSWQKRVITGPETAPDIISSAVVDLDDDGRPEIAIAYDFEMNNPKRGKLGLAIPGTSPDDPWTFRPIADVPSIHRVRWGDLDDDGRPELVAAPIFGPDARRPVYVDPALIAVFSPGDDPMAGDWERGPDLGPFPIIHAIEVGPNPLDPFDHSDAILAANNLGVQALLPRRGDGAGSIRNLVSGADGEPPARGSSEIHVGRRSGRPTFLTTIEPWHGNEVVVYTQIDRIGLNEMNFGVRTVIDDTLDQGHALWVADVNGDGNDEVFAGHRGDDHRVSAYHFDGKNWTRTVLDRDVAAQDLRGGDLDGDGTPDVVAVGGSTRNVIWYRPRPTEAD